MLNSSEMTLAPKHLKETSPETIRCSAKSLVVGWIGWLIVAATLAIVFRWNESLGSNRAAATAAIGLVLGTAVGLLILSLIRSRYFYRVDNGVVVYRKGLFQLQLRQVDLADVEAVLIKQGGILSLLDTGDILLIEREAKTQTSHRILGVANVKQRSRELEEARKSERLKFGRTD